MDEIRLINIKQEILSDNRGLADQLRAKLSTEKVFLLNIMGSPGAGKTSLILRTIESLADRYRIAVVEADIDSLVDSEKVSALGIRAVQLRTGGWCHVDASMEEKALEVLPLQALDLIILENVGNLVCPAETDTGAFRNVAILSVPEGDDKPLKYPTMFETSQVCVINKMDLLPHLNYDLEKAREYARQVNPNLLFFEVSATTGEGMDTWFDWLKSKVPKTKLVE